MKIDTSQLQQFVESKEGITFETREFLLEFIKMYNEAISDAVISEFKNPQEDKK